MGTGYTRNDTSNNIADGNIINAADLDGEFDAIESAFGTSGHTHDGTSAEGGPVTVLGPTQDFVASATEIKPKTTNTLDIGTNLLLFKDMYLDGVATLGSIKIDNGGAIGSASDADAIAISSSGVVTFSQAPLVDVTNATTNAVTDVLGIRVQSTGTPAVGIGSGLTLGVETASGNIETGGAIRIVSTGLTPTDEEIDLVFYSMRNGSLTEAFRFDSDTDSLRVEDNVKVTFGAGQDLQIYHDGTHSYIKDNGTGNLLIQGSAAIVLEDPDGNNMIYAEDGGPVYLYSNGSQKLATTSTGIDVTGTVTADGLTVDGEGIVSSTTTATDLSNPILQLSGSSYTANGVYGIGFHYDTDASGTSPVFAGYQLTSGGGNTKGNLVFGTRDTTTAGDVPLIRQTIASNGDISFYEDTGTTAKFFWDASAESLGIGTVSPSTYGGLTLAQSSDSSSNGLAIVNNTLAQSAKLWTDATNAYLSSGNTGADPLILNAGGGNVGIGTSDPATLGGGAKLTVNQAADGSIVFARGGSTRQVQLGTTSTTGYINADNTSGGLAFHMNGTERMRISSDGSCRWTPDGTNPDMTLDASGNLLVGTTTTDTTAAAGFTVQSDGQLFSSADSQHVATMTRLTNDGDILTFRRSAIGGAGLTTVGSIGSFFGNLMIGKESGARIAFSSTGIYSSNNSGTTENGSYSLGTASSRFTDLYLSGGVYGNANALKFSTDAGTSQHMTLDTSGNLLVGKTALNTNTAGLQLESDGYLSACRDGGNVALINRKTSDGAIVTFQKDGTTVGSIGTYADKVYIGNGDTGLRFVNTSNQIRPFNTSTLADRDAGFSLGSSAARFTDLYLSGGVYLGGTGAANHLDDYEEGTWTPTLTASTGNPTVTYTTQKGRYVKVGQVVTVSIDLRWTAQSGGSGNTFIAGFPFSNGDAYWGGQIFESSSSFDWGSGRTVLGFEIQQNNSQGSILVSSSQNGSGSLPIANVGTGSGYLIFSFTYRAAS